MKSSDFLKRITRGTGVTLLGMGTLIGLSACSQNSSDLAKTPEKPKDATKDCAELEWDDQLGVWKCDDDKYNTGHGGFYYYGSGWHQHSSVASLKSSAAYKSYASKPSFRGGGRASTTGFKGSSIGKAGGFASGARGGFGG